MNWESSFTKSAHKTLGGQSCLYHPFPILILADSNLFVHAIFLDLEISLLLIFFLLCWTIQEIVSLANSHTSQFLKSILFAPGKHYRLLRHILKDKLELDSKLEGKD